MREKKESLYVSKSIFVECKGQTLIVCKHIGKINRKVWLLTGLTGNSKHYLHICEKCGLEYYEEYNLK